VKTLLPPARAYFVIGVEEFSKAVNLGNLLRSAHAFGASVVSPSVPATMRLRGHVDTSKAPAHLPLQG
jgi:tRNA G18 (ribose-2'-O)-methylase SpoU